MKKLLSKRITLWGIVVVYAVFSMATWDMYEAKGVEAPILVFIVSIGFLMLYIVASVFRCHELNWSGWRVLAYPVPIVGLLLLLFLLFKKPSAPEGFGENIASS